MRTLPDPVKRGLAILPVALLLIGGCTARGSATAENCYIEKAPPRDYVRCADAVTTAEGVAESEHVRTGAASATLKTYPVAKGESHPAWWVTWADMQYDAPNGTACPPESFYVMVDATNGAVLAHDVPSCGPS
jgi:hypothetical protein